MTYYVRALIFNSSMQQLFYCRAFHGDVELYMLSIQLFQDFPWDCSITYFYESVNILHPYYVYPDLNRGIITVCLFYRIVIQRLTKPMRVPTIVNLWCLPSRIKQEPVKIPYPDSEVKPTDMLARFTRSSHILLPPTARSAQKVHLGEAITSSFVSVTDTGIHL